MDVSKIRKDFTILSKTVDGKPLIYFDNACQTLRPRQVYEAANRYYEEFPACAGRSVHRLATEVTLRCDEVREKAAAFFHTETPEEVAFMKNSTEGLNTVILGSGLRKGDEVVTTDYEHNSVLIPVLKLRDEVGIRHRIIRSAPDDTFDLDAFEKTMSKRVKLVAMCLTSNVTGFTLPARDVVEIAHEHGARVLFDAAQAAPSVKLDVRSLGVDYMAASAHKMCGPSGVGFLIVRAELGGSVTPLIYGGHGVTDTSYDSFSLLQAPERFEMGLQNYSGIIGAGAALDYLTGIGLDEIRSHEVSLNRRMTHALRDVDRISIVGPEDPNLRGGIFSFNMAGLSPHDVAMVLDQSKNIMMRSGMHCCHPFFHARGLDGCARASVYAYNTSDEADAFSEALVEMADRFPR